MTRKPLEEVMQDWNWLMQMTESICSQTGTSLHQVCKTLVIKCF